MAQGNGSAGRRWLADLLRLVWAFAQRWAPSLGDRYPGGVCALVLRVTQRDRPVVHEVSRLDDETPPEPDVLRLWEGDGAVRPLASIAGRWTPRSTRAGGSAPRGAGPGPDPPFVGRGGGRAVLQMGEDPGERLALARVLTAPDRLSRWPPR